MNLDNLLIKNLLPDQIIRFGIRNLLKQRLKSERKNSPEEQKKHFMGLVNYLSENPIAVNTAEANEQHYEVPTEFYKNVLGAQLKYSSGFWEYGANNLDEAENDMLALTCERAQLINGQEILELGCGWGSLTLFMAEKYPDSNITAVSNSRTQKEFIDGEAGKRGLKNITVITSDINDFEINKKFNRVVSVEMFEHLRNYKTVFNKIYDWLESDGQLFIHIFSHNKYAYLFEVKDDTDWMAKYFFTGGIMPSDNLLLYFSENFEVKNHWVVDGKNYERTANAWLDNMDNNKYAIMNLFSKIYGEENRIKWWVYWRVFFMSCAELWGYKNGNEWFVSHYLFKKV